MMEGLGNLPCKKRLKTLGLYCLEKLFLHREPHGENKGQQVQVALGEVSSQCKYEFFTMRTTVHWNTLPREMEESPSFSACRCTGCWIILSGLLSHERWDEISL